MKRVSAAIAIACLLAACSGSANSGNVDGQASPPDVGLHERSVQFERAYEQSWHVSKDVADCVMAYENANQSESAITDGLAVNPHQVLSQIDCTKP